MKYDQILIHTDPDNFEELVNAICQEILGLGTVSFTKGPDGGKDGRFTGTANKFPSLTAPWSGKMIIQAKHTALADARCSSGEFFTNAKSVVNKEIERLVKLKKKEGLDYYLLFTNRKYTGNNDADIIKKISAGIGLPESNIAIIGIETMNSYLSKHKEIATRFNLHEFYVPFDFSDQDIKTLILKFHDNLTSSDGQLKDGIEQVKRDFTKISDPEKNKKNGLGEDYYENNILGESLGHFAKIEDFLAAPMNAEIKEIYYDIVDDLRQIIQIKRDNFEAFEHIFRYIHNFVCQGSSELSGKKRYVNIFLHYMYHSCSIGLK